MSPRERRPALAVVGLLALLTACESAPDTRQERWEGPLDADRARRIVVEGFTMRAHPNPHLDRPRPDHELLAVDDQRIRFRAVGDDSSPVREVRFADVTRVATRDEDDSISRTQTILVFVAEGSPSAAAATGSDLLGWIGIDDPYMALTGRDPALVDPFRRAIACLASRASRAPSRSRVEDFIDEYEATEEERRREAAAERRQYERIERLLEDGTPGSDRGQE